jgi:hypothetical protein
MQQITYEFGSAGANLIMLYRGVQATHCFQQSGGGWAGGVMSFEPPRCSCALGRIRTGRLVPTSARQLPWSPIDRKHHPRVLVFSSGAEDFLHPTPTLFTTSQPVKTRGWYICNYLAKCCCLYACYRKCIRSTRYIICLLTFGKL